MMSLFSFLNRLHLSGWIFLDSAETFWSECHLSLLIVSVAEYFLSFPVSVGVFLGSWGRLYQTLLTRGCFIPQILSGPAFLPIAFLQIQQPGLFSEGGKNGKWSSLSEDLAWYLSCDPQQCFLNCLLFKCGKLPIEMTKWACVTIISKCMISIMAFHNGSHTTFINY